MKTTNKFLKLLVLVFAITFAACSNNNDDILEEEELSEIVMQDFADDIQNMSVPAGLANSNNQYAQQANAQFEALKSLGTSYASLFTIPANATSAKSSSKTASKSTILSTKTYTWSSGDTTINYTISEESDRYSFTYNIVSSSFTGKLMDGYQLKDGSYAQANLYSDNQLVSTIKWTVTETTTKIELDSDGYRFVLESNNSDNSGTLKLYESSTLYATYLWNANGSGTYTDHLNNETYSW